MSNRAVVVDPDAPGHLVLRDVPDPIARRFPGKAVLTVGA